MVNSATCIITSAHAAAALDNMQQGEGEPLKLYMHHYSVREFSEFTSPAHVVAALDNMQQGKRGTFKIICMHYYSVIHKMVTGLNAVQNMQIHHDGCPF